MKIVVIDGLVFMFQALEVIMNRIKLLHSRLDRKEQILESYDDDLKRLR